MTLLEDLITLLGVASLEVFGQFNRIATLLEDLQIVVKPTLLRDLDHCYNGLRVTVTWPNLDATELSITYLNFGLYTWSFLIEYIFSAP